mmetsp:Transcript_30679/g.88986  ORF Transcript_30679/g.88986 Transcript_30679/m.88986 type:complete len:243 (+) Transcript_30679:490-1218(+)
MPMFRFPTSKVPAAAPAGKTKARPRRVVLRPPRGAAPRPPRPMIQSSCRGCPSVGGSGVEASPGPSWPFDKRRRPRGSRCWSGEHTQRRARQRYLLQASRPESNGPMGWRSAAAGSAVATTAHSWRMAEAEASPLLRCHCRIRRHDTGNHIRPMLRSADSRRMPTERCPRDGNEDRHRRQKTQRLLRHARPPWQTGSAAAHGTCALQRSLRETCWPGRRPRRQDLRPRTTGSNRALQPRQRL